MLIRTFGILCFLLSFETGFPQTICPTGKFGENCDQDCSSNCFKNCHKITGACIDACIIGKYGSHCNDDCSECQFGCDKDTGACPCDLYGCAECGSTNGTCQLCDETRHMFPSSVDPLKCCSRGCPTQQGGVLDCHANGVCKLEGCLPDYWGDRCTKCSNMIEHCNYCSFLQNTDDLICRECLSGYTLSNDEFRCCPVGCDDCAGDVCSKCKDGYYIYGEICDTCGEYCNPPSNGSARCDPNTGRCYYGCLEDWHGSQCQKHCDLPNCETCDYFEEADRLTCITCSDGYAPNATSGLCETCNSNCINGSCDSSTGSCTEGCLPGWRADRCDMTCAQAGLSNCSVCGRGDSTCSKCLFDFWGAVCEMGCSEHCVPVDDDNVCHKDTAACARGCLPGYWQDDCTNECPNCLGDLCQIDDGICQQNACKPGYWGRNCMSPCSSTCADNPATGDRECGFQNGFCTHGCKYNRYGDICEKDCSRNCFDNTTTTNPDDKEPLCYQESAICKWGCNDGYYHRDCTGTCESTCVTGACDILEGYCLECNKTQPGWLCYSGECEAGSYGRYCNMSCPGGDNCIGGICNRNTSACEGCIANFWGDTCQDNCSTCVNGSCNQDSGICNIGCMDGYFGARCREMCIDRCDVCNRADGSCTRCSVGMFGPLCQYNCNTNCALKDGELLCNKVTGACLSEKCKPGFYGLSCNLTCYEHCFAVSDVAVCEYDTGYCTDECEIGWYGALCTGQCSSNCRNRNCRNDVNNCTDGCIDEYYGDLCLEPCSFGCYMGICSDVGYCKAGCIREHYGDMCSKTCNETCIDDYCDRQSGNCVECSKPDPNFLCRWASCDVGYYGKFCNMSCPSKNCLDNRCHRDETTGGQCDGCVPGQYGNYCNEECDRCTNGNCTQESGRCLEGCDDGWWGLQCDLDCSHCVRCRQYSGVCTECSGEKYGSACELDCSVHCQPAATGIKSCNINTAKCDSGACLPGYYGDNCETACHINCKPDNKGDVLCDFKTGECLANCTDLFYGVHCERACESYCHDNTCHRETGTCADCDADHPPPNCPDAQCNVTFFGQFCNSSCPQGCEKGCHRYTSKCANCKPGLYGEKCTQDCPYDGCFTCVQSTGACDTCIAGKYGMNCDKDCGDCEPVDGEIRCDMMTGHCSSDTCLPGTWGLHCNLKCNENCAGKNGKDICDRFNGVCTLGCDVSTFGDFCDGNCSTTCKNSNCTDTANNCLEGCAPGYYGLKTCQTPCSVNCAHGICNENDGVCTDGCNAGFYQEQCSRACLSTCINMKCDRATGHCLECEQDTPDPYFFCRSAVCDKGFQGEYCNVTCPTNCKAECERYVTKCKGCIPSFWGDECKTSCHNCQNGICNQTSGVCDVGCNPGYFNPYCEQPCVFGGCKTCNRNSGLCITCKDELHGEACERNCSKQCTPDRNGLHMCYKDTGVCEEGSCLAGAWGLDCSQSCNINCKKDAFGDRVCYYLSGNCSSGCEDKFWDDQCDKPCSDTCLYGLCKRDSTCLLGCEAGTYGAGCEKDCKDTCNDGTCDRLSGLCMECNKTLEEQTELCRTAECPSGVKGLYCNESCPDNCFETCNRYSDTCAGCKSGFYGDLCEDECRECVGVSCTQTTGTCEEGCVAGWYGLQCNKKCLDNECQICDVFTGTCTECKPSYYGNKCEKNCSSFCAESNDNTIRCDIILGHCSAAECKDGYYLKDCTKSCNEKCGKDFKDERPCNILTGKCMHDCEPGWYGDMCDRECSVHCEDGLCNRTGHCITGCETGFYGGDCRLTCAPSLTCNDGTCHRYNGNCSACDEPEPTPRCTTADCDKGFYGLYCNMMCPVNCYGGVCIRDSGLCQDCNLAWYGSNCTSRCPNCKEDICIQSNGHCIRGCKDGFYKDKCDEPCLYEGCQDCSRDSGMCITCKVGKYNSNCSEDCSPRCELTDKGLRTCSKASGDCDAKACIPGYWSETCRQECSSYCDTTDNECDLKSGSCTPCKVGHFGLTCRLECSVRCKNQNCDATLDNCLQGCADGFWGAACEKQCNGNCQQKLCNISSGACTLGCERDMFYGPTCKEPCNSNCVGGECETDGYCRDGCKTGTYGRRCENACPDKATCTDGTCDRILGYCSECDAADPGPLCPTAVCPSGKWGLNCTNDCFSKTCLFNRCTRDEGICIGCPIGSTGSQCDRSCGQCKVGTGCDQITGFCGEGCRDGYYGDECKQQCDLVCKSCERQPPAKCVECTDNRWGPSCLKTCNPNCAKTIIGSLEYTLCDKGTGYCSEGACINNKNWNDDCSKTCPQNCLPDNNGYKTCRISDGACSIGCVDTYYGVHCTERCSTQCRGQICKDEANNCVNGCENGFYNPPTCSGTCSEHCKESRNCDRVTGTCADGCAAGYFGLQCIEQCYGKCKDGTCDDLGGCPDCRISPVGPNCHPQVCPPLKYGPSCESDCPGLYCKDDACHRQTGKCPQGCRDWFHGEYCTERCICHVAGTTLCNQTGICECKTGWTSVDCSQRCSDGCRNSVCEKNGQCTFGCIAGRYGTTCENKCINCVNEACDSDTGKCDIGCKPGYYGMRCDSQCPENCYTCDSSSECTACLPFRYGLPSCNQRCSSTCKQPSSGRVCYESNGACIGGCLLGFWDDQCTRQCGSCGGDGTCLQPTGTCTAECLPGYTTLTCATPCSDSCAKGGSSNQRECRRDTGACEHGCEMGYHGDFCEPCSDRCLDNKCSSAFICTDGCIAPYYSKKSGCNLECSGCQNGRCNDTGSCLTGCAKGFHGTMCTTVCSKTCTDGTCDQLTGQCKDCKETPVGPLCREPDIETATVVTTDERLSMEAIIGISAGCAVAVILIAILMVCCVFYRRKATDAKNEIHLPSEVLERLSNHGRSHHSTISSQYPVARVVGDDEKDFVLF